MVTGFATKQKPLLRREKPIVAPVSHTGKHLPQQPKPTAPVAVKKTKANVPQATCSSKPTKSVQIESIFDPAISAVPIRIPQSLGVSTVAKQKVRRKEVEVEKLQRARLARQSKECTILEHLLKGKKEFLRRLHDRTAFLQTENEELRNSILDIEHSTMNRVKDELNSTTKAITTNEDETRQFHRDFGEVKQHLLETKTTLAGTKQYASEQVEDMDFAVNQRVFMLKELIDFRRHGEIKNAEYIERLKEKVIAERERLETEFKKERISVEVAISDYHTEHSREQGEILSLTTDQTIAAMAPGVVATAVTNVDLEAAIKDQSTLAAELKQSVATLKAEHNKLKRIWSGMAKSNQSTPKNVAVDTKNIKISRANQVLLSKFAGLVVE